MPRTGKGFTALCGLQGFSLTPVRREGAVFSRLKLWANASTLTYMYPDFGGVVSVLALSSDFFWRRSQRCALSRAFRSVPATTILPISAHCWEYLTVWTCSR